MALIAALLLTILLSTAVAGMAIVSAIERRAAAAYALSVELRAACEGALAATVGELVSADWNVALAGAGSTLWRDPPPGVDVAALTGEVRASAMMTPGHGADTPVWQVFAQGVWGSVTGVPGKPAVLTWVADDWSDQDGDPGRDSNGLLLVRAAAVSAPARAWAEALCVREAGGTVRVKHVRSW